MSPERGSPSGFCSRTPVVDPEVQARLEALETLVAWLQRAVEPDEAERRVWVRKRWQSGMSWGSIANELQVSTDEFIDRYGDCCTTETVVNGKVFVARLRRG
jgi:hypothetical protein